VTEQLGAPQSATVIAISLNARGDLARSRFTDLLSSVLAHACHIQPATGQNNELAYTAIVPDSTQILSLLRRLLSLQAEFGRIHPDCAARFMVHHGIIFPSANNFLGAALRSAHSRLARLPANIPSAATEDFANYAATWASSPVIFSKLFTGNATPTLLAFSIVPSSTKVKTASRAHDEALLHHLTNCLASHIGPFAEVLVDAAKRSSTSTDQLIEELASEISTPNAREKFRSDALAYATKHPR